MRREILFPVGYTEKQNAKNQYVQLHIGFERIHSLGFKGTIYIWTVEDLELDFQNQYTDSHSQTVQFTH